MHASTRHARTHASACAKRCNARRWHRAFYWDRGEEIEEPLRGLAYNYTIQSLLKRHRYRKGRLVAPACHLPPPAEVGERAGGRPASLFSVLGLPGQALVGACR